MQLDKKAREGTVRFALPKAIGAMQGGRWKERLDGDGAGAGGAGGAGCLVTRIRSSPA